MNANGLGLSAWLTLLGVVFFFFVVPATYLEIDRRKRLRRNRVPILPRRVAEPSPEASAPR